MLPDTMMLSGGVPPPSVLHQHMETLSTLELVQNVLRQYPDNGQILKELVQNADDAGAKTIKFMLDERQHGEQTVFYPKLAQYQGPSLLTFNDSTLQDDDFIGLLNLFKSIKSDDPLKVGKFGLGFKSSYHMTDCVSYVSRDVMAFLEPHEQIFTDREGRKAYSYAMNLKTAHGHGYKDQMEPFKQEIFGLGDQEFKNGSYNGTVFRFPLRQLHQASQLDTNPCYDPSKVLEMFEDMKKDGHLYLLFLKSIEKIELYHRPSHAAAPTFLLHIVKLSDSCALDIRHSRLNFYSRIQANMLTREKVSVSFRMDIELMFEGKSIAESYLVQQEFQRVSENVDKLMDSTKQLPLVGAALPLSTAPIESSLLPDNVGHLFCFLPLPMEGHTLTGLGVHINGAFAVTPNRKNIKLPTAEDNRTDHEKEIRWNLALMTEILPGCLASLAETAVAYWKDEIIGVEQMCRLFPMQRKLKCSWKSVRGPFHALLQNCPVLYSEGREVCLTVSQAVFLPLDDPIGEEKKAVLVQGRVNVVELPAELSNDLLTLPGLSTANTADPHVLKALKQLGMQINASAEARTQLLVWTMSKGTKYLAGTALLPLLNDTWTLFTNQPCYYLSRTDAEVDLFPGAKPKFVKMAYPIDRQFWENNNLDGLNLAWFNLSHLKIELSTSPFSLSLDYLERIWNHLYVNCRSDLSLFNGLKLLPIQRKNHSLNPSACVLLLSNARGPIDATIQASLVRMGVTVAMEAAVPSWVWQHPAVTGNYLLVEDNLDVLLKRLQPLNRFVLTKVERTAWQRLLSHHARLRNLIDVLKEFRLFDDLCQEGRHGYSMSQLSTGITFSWGLNVRLNNNFLDLSHTDSKSLAVALGASVLDRKAFLLTYVLPNAHTFTGPQCEQVAKFCLNDRSLANDGKIRERLTMIKFLRGKDGSYNQPAHYLNPKDKICQDLFGSHFPEKFPESSLVRDHLPLLLQLGLREAKDFTQNEIGQIILHIHNNPNATVLVLSTKLMEFLYFNRTKLDKYSDHSWVAVESARPTDYPEELTWLADSIKFACPSQFVTKETIGLCGSAKAQVQALYIPFALSEPTKAELFAHWKHILDQMQASRPSRSLISAYLKQLKKLAEQFSAKHFLLQLEKYHIDCWVLASLHKIVSTDQVVLSMPREERLEPWLHTVSRELIQHEDFLVDCGIMKGVTQKRLVELVIDLEEKTRDASLNEAPFNLIVTAAKMIYDLRQEAEFAFTDNMFLPNRDGVLKPVKGLAYDSCPWLEEPGEETERCHSSVPATHSLYFGVQKTQDVIINQHSFGIPFGQKEKLTHRINRLLTGYQSESIVKELLQNADDANATEVHFVLDRRTHEAESVFDAKWSALQGPALLIYNDKPFSQADLEGISNLGEGSKQNDPLKTGQYGVGFNSVYNVTDTPMFLTTVEGEGRLKKKRLVAFDPNAKYVYGASDLIPGRMFNVDKLNKFVDVMVPFNVGKQCNWKPDGTIFRLPLRTPQQAVDSDICKKSITAEELKLLLDDFCRQGVDENLLFLRNVRRIRISQIDYAGYVDELEDVTLAVDRACQKELDNYIEDRKQWNDYLIGGHVSLSEIPHRSICVPVKIKKSGQYLEKTKEKSWMVSLAHGFSDPQAEEVKKLETAYSEGEIRHNVNVGVAWIPNVSTPRNNLFGKIFCLLPVSRSQLSFHVNAHFALNHESREQLIRQTKSSLGHKWNMEVSRKILAPTFIEMLKEARKKEIFKDARSLNDYLDHYTSLYPDRFQSEPAMEAFVEAVYSLIEEDNIEVFPRVEGLSITYVSLKEAVFFDHRFWLHQSANKKSNLITDNEYKDLLDKSELAETLLALGMSLICLPFEACKKLKSYKQLGQKTLIEFLHQCNNLKENLPCHVKNTPFKTWYKLRLFANMVLKPFLPCIRNLPILLTQDEFVHQLGSERTLQYCSRFSDLVHCPSEFVHDRHITMYSAEAFTPFFATFDAAALAKRLHTKDNWQQGGEQVFVLDPKEKTIPSKLSRIWKFLDQDQSSGEERFAADLGNWSLFPCLLSNGDCVSIPLSSAIGVFDTSTTNEASSGGMTTILDQCLHHKPWPELCHRQFKEGRFIDGNQAYRKCLGSMSSPKEITNALYKVRAAVGPVMSKERSSMMQFFQNSRQHLEASIVRQFPVFEISTGEVKAIEKESCLCLKKLLPPFKPPNKLILSSVNLVWTKLLQHLSIEVIGRCKAYSDYILPNFLQLYVETQKQHLYMLAGFPQEKLQWLTEQLKQTGLIQGQRVGQFHDGKDYLLKKFYPQNSIPKEYKEIDGRAMLPFLTALDLQTKPTEDQLLNIVRQLAGRGSTSEDYDLTLSKTLERCLTHDSSPHFLQMLSQIKFLPKKLSPLQRHLEMSSQEKICFSSSVLVSDATVGICWSQVVCLHKGLVSHLFPSHCSCDQSIRRHSMYECGEAKTQTVYHHLNCREDTNSSHLIVPHLTSVSEKMEDLLESSRNTTALAQSYLQEMKIVFDYLHSCHKRPDLRSLGSMRLIPLQEDLEDLVTPESLVTTAFPLEVPGFLISSNEIADELKSYRGLLIEMGAKEKTKLVDYTEILRCFEENAEVDEDDWEKVVVPVYKFIIKFLYESSDKTEINAVKELLLPDYNRVVRKSSSLVYVDDNELFGRMQESSEEAQLLRPEDIAGKIKGALEKLPESLKPKPFSSVFKEVIVEDWKESPHSFQLVDELLCRFRDEDFGTALLKISTVNARKAKSQEKQESSYVEDMVQTILSLEVYAVEGLRTVLLYNDEITPDSEGSKHYHFQKNPDTEILSIFVDTNCNEASTPSFIKSDLLDYIEGLLELNAQSYRKCLQTILDVPLHGIVDVMKKTAEFALNPEDGEDVPAKLGTRFEPNTNTKRKLLTSQNRRLKKRELVWVLKVEEQEEEDEEENKAFYMGRVLELLKDSDTNYLTERIYKVDFGGPQPEEVPNCRIFTTPKASMKNRPDAPTKEEQMEIIKQELKNLMDLLNKPGTNPLSLLLMLAAVRIQELVEMGMEEGEDILLGVQAKIDVIKRKNGKVVSQDTFTYKNVFKVCSGPTAGRENGSAGTRSYGLGSVVSGSNRSVGCGFTQSTPPPCDLVVWEEPVYERSKYPNVKHAKLMLKQAKHDLAAVRNDWQNELKSPCWAAYKILQASEKALKAVIFLEDGSSELSHSHGLYQLSVAAGIARAEASGIERRLGNQNSVRYPKSHHATYPADSIKDDDNLHESYAMAKRVVSMAETKVEGRSIMTLI